MHLTHNFKEILLETCKKIILEKAENANKAMQDAQAAANGEEKSSAGDKYETSRAMGHRDRDMYARQLVDFKNELTKLEKINLEFSKSIKLGSLIEVNENYYFIATGIGKVIIENIEVMVISKDAPISQLLLSKKQGDHFIWNDKGLKIINIW